MIATHRNACNAEQVRNTARRRRSLIVHIAARIERQGLDLGTAIHAVQGRFPEFTPETMARYWRSDTKYRLEVRALIRRRRRVAETPRILAASRDYPGRYRRPAWRC